MPKKTPETETVDSLDQELSTALPPSGVISTTGIEESESTPGIPEGPADELNMGMFPITDAETASGEATDGVGIPDTASLSPTETGGVAGLDQAPEDGSEAADADTVLQERPGIKTKRTIRAATKEEAEPVIQKEELEHSPELFTEPTAPARRPRRRGIVSLDGRRSELTPEARRRQDIIDLSESMKSRRIITGTIAGIERMDENPDLAYAVIYHGAFKVIIPAREMFEFDEDSSENYRGATISRRLGAEIDYVVKGIEADANIAAGSRLDAMRQRRREYYLDTDRNGHRQLEEGDIAEARVVSVIRLGAFVELFGIEQFVPLEELSYLRWVDATMHFRVGERVLVKILELDRSDRNHISIKLSVKQAGEDAFKQAISRFKIGNLYVGTVTMITAVGVFVSFENVSCLCQFPKRKRPSIGSPVTVRILGADLERLRLWGVIVYT